MLHGIARLAIAAPRRIIAVALLVMVGAGIFGIPVTKSLSAGGFQDRMSESWQASRLLSQQFDRGDMQMLIAVTSDAGALSGAARAAGTDIVAQLQASRYVAQVDSAWTVPPPGAPALISKDGKTGLIVARNVDRIAGVGLIAPAAADITRYGLGRMLATPLVANACALASRIPASAEAVRTTAVRATAPIWRPVTKNAPTLAALINVPQLPILAGFSNRSPASTGHQPSEPSAAHQRSSCAEPGMWSRHVATRPPSSPRSLQRSSSLSPMRGTC